MTHKTSRWLWALVFGALMQFALDARSETCVTQSQMEPAERTALETAARSLALKIQVNDQDGVKSATIPEFVANFNGIGSAVSTTAPYLAGNRAEVEQIYLLDATASKRNPDGSNPDGDFICTLNKGTSEADFSINALPPGRYGFAMVEFTGKAPWLVSMLLRQDGAGAPWKLAGFFPKALTAAGHDGLWYWSQGRAAAAKKQLWVAYMDFQEARVLLQPASFVSSTHLENLRVEATSAAPPEAADGVGPDAPLLVKGANGKEYRFTSIDAGDSLHKDKLDIVVHLINDPTITDPVAARQRNLDAMKAWLTLHPEMRETFHGMWVISDTPGQPPIATTEASMSEID